MSEAPTVTGALEQVSGAQRMIDAANFAAVLPRQLPPGKFQRWAVHVLSKPELVKTAATEIGRLTIMKALMDCASLGLEPGREFHLVPFEGKDKDGNPKPLTVTGITDYKGEIRLITNARRCSVVAQLVREGDMFYMRAANAPPMHEPADAEKLGAAAWFDDTRPVIGGYAYCAYPEDEYSMVIRMSEAGFLKHRAKARTVNVWDEWPEQMRLKTLVHQLRKWVPWSPEWIPS
jgi:recombination protein RecT